jgi:hypothetical protein
MTEEEWVHAFWLLWIRDWPYSTQQDRAELLDVKARIETVTGWAWSPPFTLDNPPRIALPPA